MDIAHTDQPAAYPPKDNQQPTADNNQHPTSGTPRKPLRLWPGVAAAVVLAVAWFILPYVLPEMFLYGLLASLGAIVAIILWWLLFSRARWYERLGAVALIVVAVWATSRVVHISIRTGSMGFLFPVLALPVMALALVGWAAATRRLTDSVRRLSFLAIILVVCGVFTLIRTGGFTGDFDHDFQWRWSKTPEERLLAQADEEPFAASTSTEAVKTGAEWPGFRGPDRDGVVRGTRIKTDWSSSRPVELWRRPVGPGWSSFAVSGDRIYTQEQRGADEIVACYDIKTGKPLWRHRDAARFWESNAGPGPRGTPTLGNGRVYTLGATGILNVLEANDGKVVWSRNAASDTSAQVPIWGFSGSPLIVDDLVVVATGGDLVAYDIGTGNPRWFGPDGGHAYSSPHLMTINGVRQIVLLREQGATSHAPSDGKILWEHPWEGVPIVQPAVTADGNVLISVSESSGTRSLAVTQQGTGWSVQERWTSEALNPYYNDFVIHNGYAYGFDWNTLSCIDLKDGSRKWKGGRYGHGQLVLLRDQNLLLVLAELGDLALVKASPDGFTELARIPAIKGKTWNHPVLAGDIVLVRNGEEMAAFKLPVDGG